ncbi:hypothetical protein LENED_004032 [Lentinula edodes]|uniref:Uncharacterized protein n=1 Tax=Lentinula edodes TaxID=5353 RepID=A0A1Q3E560_LENED|nr:hypothetical protein LENED_004032 [Lentinula edodes]
MASFTNMGYAIRRRNTVLVPAILIQILSDDDQESISTLTFFFDELHNREVYLSRYSAIYTTMMKTQDSSFFFHLFKSQLR